MNRVQTQWQAVAEQINKWTERPYYFPHAALKHPPELRLPGYFDPCHAMGTAPHGSTSKLPRIFHFDTRASKTSSLTMSTVTHPYFPASVKLSGDIFIENDWDVPTLIAVFGAGWAAIMVVTLMVVRKLNPKLRGADQGLVLWFALCELLSKEKPIRRSGF